MQIKQLVWQDDKRQYANGVFAHIGNRILFSCCWDACRSDSDKEKPYLLTTRLPIRVKEKYTRFASIDEAKIVAQDIFEHFIRTSFD